MSEPRAKVFPGAIRLLLYMFRAFPLTGEELLDGCPHIGPNHTFFPQSREQFKGVVLFRGVRCKPVIL